MNEVLLAAIYGLGYCRDAPGACDVCMSKFLGEIATVHVSVVERMTPLALRVVALAVSMSARNDCGFLTGEEDNE